MTSTSTQIKTGPKSARHLYRRAWLGLIPVVGVMAGLSLMSLAIAKYKDKFLFLAGVVATVPYLLLFFFMVIYSESDAARSHHIVGTQEMMNKVVREIEFYHLQHKQYPDSLEQLRMSNKSVNIWDPMSAKGSQDLKKFNYNRSGKKYELFSPGLDRLPHTKDDIFPTVDTTGIGLVNEQLGQ